MVSLSNIQRLLAAQAFNKRVIAEKLARGKRLSTSKSRIGVLTGVKPRVVQGKVVGLTTQKSQTRLTTEKQLRSEIAFQAKQARRETDLEKFLKNERALRAGQVSLSALNRQIATRKARGLSKTPAQRAALQTFTGVGDVRALGARAGRKKARGISRSLIQTPQQILATKRAEEERAAGLGSSIFADPVSLFGGRTRAEQVARGGTFGRRAGGKSLSSQIDFVRSTRINTSNARIGLAQSLLGDPFSGASNTRLLGVVGTKTRAGLRRLTTPTFQEKLREDVGFFTTEAIPFTERDAPKTRKATLARAKTLQAARTKAARRTLAGQALFTRQPKPADDFERISVLGTRVTEQPKLGTTQILLSSLTGGFLDPRPTKAGVSPAQRLAQARETQRETEALRASPFQPRPLTPARGVPTITETFSPTLPRQGQVFTPSFRPSASNIFDVSLGIETDVIFGTTPKKKKKAKGKRPKPRGAGTEFDFDFGEFEDIFSGELASGVSIGAAISESELFEPFR